ncbi:MAG: sulfotransferase [Candidatus Heimdallarchaeota archaeon]|nr:sulfotransferase [Candidatus Heimdallarchaeota archaeon]MCK5159925.1 sulfotransferase [Candidatus Heimdallarchaeota archaeon]MCK5297637.1 sulfotransferase [Candidatus Heimdallarchaeota archaeon]
MKTVVILTQPRSGSSLLAGILHHLGVYMGEEKELQRGTYKNKLGSFEDHRFLALNHNILFKAERLMGYHNRFSDEDGKVEAAVKEYMKELEEYVKENEREFWGFKEAVVIYTIPYFEHLLKDPHYIVLHRDAESVANSQIRAGKLRNWPHEIKSEFSYFTRKLRFKLFLRTMKTTFTKGFVYRERNFIIKLTLDAQERIKRFIENRKNIIIELSQIIKNPEETIEKIIKFLGLKPTKEQIKNAIDFIRPELITSNIKKPDQ